ncbi:MAG TPA: alpha/beta fold hydrolase [Gammaproteobacteria bacterium]|nr:alpha/beta fold hydrolase [Gammaproteobacteria bacterium]
MSTADEHDVLIHADDVFLDGILSLPAMGAQGIVIFAHGSGSSRFSKRNRQVAACLNDAGFATLLFDLLTKDENEKDIYTAEYRFNIHLLSQRLVKVVDWLMLDNNTNALPAGLFGASTGAAAALVAAADRPERVKCVVSRGGRPDLAGEALSRVKAPTLLLVGSRDTDVIELNRLAAARIRCEYQLTLVSGATHLFEEPGALERVSQLASEWFTRHLLPHPRLERPMPHRALRP